jgi:hypothetical protein
MAMLSLIQFGEDAAAGAGAEGAEAEGGIGGALKEAVKQHGEGNGQPSQKLDASSFTPITPAGQQGGTAMPTPPPARPPVSNDGETALKAASSPHEPGSVQYGPR